MAIKRLRLVRLPWTEEGTRGVLIFGGTYTYTLELPYLNNIKSYSSIPVGVYPGVVTFSPRMKKMYPLLLNTGSRTGVRVHPANFAGNELLKQNGRQVYVSHLEGCIAPCLTFQRIKNPLGNAQLAGLNSQTAMRKLNEYLQGQKFELDIRTE